MAIAYRDLDTGAVVEKEPWRWQVIYDDGTVLNQFDLTTEGPVFLPFAKVDQDKAVSLRLVHDKFSPIIIPRPDDSKFIHYYKNLIRQTEHVANTGEKYVVEDKERYYIVGFESAKLRTLIMAYANGKITLFNNQTIEKFEG